MKIWLTIKWIKNDQDQWVVMVVYFGHLLPDPDFFSNYTCQLVEAGKEARLFPPGSLVDQQKNIIAS